MLLASQFFRLRNLENPDKTCLCSIPLGNNPDRPRLAFQLSENARTNDQCRHRVQRKPRTRSKEGNHGKVWKELGLQRKSFQWLRIPSFVVGVAELLVGAGTSACRPVQIRLHENVHPGDGFQDEEGLALRDALDGYHFAKGDVYGTIRLTVRFEQVKLCQLFLQQQYGEQQLKCQP